MNVFKRPLQRNVVWLGILLGAISSSACKGKQETLPSPGEGAGAYGAGQIYEDILFFESRVSSDERELFRQNHQAIGDAILDACSVYFPDIPVKNCARIFVANVLKESTFNQFEAHETDRPDPTLGLLQIRETSTVEDYNQYGNTSFLTERGIFYADPTNDQMMGILYNIHMGLWYISVHARSNAQYARTYCTDKESLSGTGSISVGLSCHRIGPTAYQEGRNLDTAANYVNQIKESYLELFARTGETPDADYFTKTLSYLDSLCAP